jgi:hypothetical protein
MADLPPPRSDVAVAAGPRPAPWVAWAVVAALAVTAAGGYAVTAAFDDPGGAPVEIGGAVRVSPLSGWATAGPVAVRGWTFGRLTRGTATLDVGVAALPAGAPEEVARAYLDDFLRRQLTRLSVDEELEAVTLASGVVGVRFRYAGFLRDSATAIEGEVTALRTSAGGAVAFDAWSPEGSLTFAIGDAHAMIDAAAIA